MKYTFIAILLLSFVTLDSCIPMDTASTILATIKIKNNSNDTIGYFRDYKKNISDTFLPISKPNFNIGVGENSWKIFPFTFKTQEILSNGGIYPDLQKYLNDNILIYFFLNLDSINTLPWSKICEKNIYLKRVIIDTKQDLDSCNYEITYP